MGLTAEQLRESIDALVAMEPRFAAAIDRVGMPEPRVSARGYATLLRTIVGQQVSVASAKAVWNKLDTVIGSAEDPAALIAASDEMLRTAGLSRQKASYARSLAGLVISGELDLANLAEADEAAIAALVAVRGIGRWSAEIYLLFAEGRRDIWPAGDLAVQIELGRLLALPEKPSERAARELAEPWRPHRGALAILCWHHYNTPVL